MERLEEDIQVTRLTEGVRGGGGGGRSGEGNRRLNSELRNGSHKKLPPGSTCLSVF